MSRAQLSLEKIRFMPPQLREIGFHVENHATQWHGFQHEIQFQEIVVAWIQLTLKSMLWCTGKNRMDYKNFGDVFTFDTTYRTNLYSLPFGIFVGVNCHFQSIYIWWCSTVD